MGAKSEPNDAEKVVMTVCHSHCGGACPLKLHVRDGVITRIETDDEFRACLRGRAYRQRLYGADRLKYPMKRVGERGSGEFERISWDEALDTVASEIKRVNKTYGPSSVSFICSAGDICFLHSAGLIHNVLVKTGGYSGCWGKLSDEGAWFASMTTYGTLDEGTVNTRDDWLNSRLIILWGWNTAVTRGYDNTPWYLAEARDEGKLRFTLNRWRI